MVFKFGSKHIDDAEQSLFFFGYRRYMYEGRFLTREEVVGLMNVHFKPTNKVSAIDHDMFNVFNKSNEGLTVALERYVDKYAANLWVQIDGYFRQLLAADEGAKARETALKGFKGALSDHVPIIPDKMPRLKKKSCRVDELYVIYDLMHFCIDDKGSMTSTKAKRIWAHRHSMDLTHGNVSIFKDLANRDHWMTKLVDGAMTKREHDHFGNRALGMARELYPNARLTFEPEPGQGLASQGDLDPKTTLGLEGLSLQASASVPTLPAPRYQYSEQGRREAEPRRDQQADSSESSEDEVIGKGKGKQTEKGKGKGRAEPRDQRSKSPDPMDRPTRKQRTPPKPPKSSQPRPWDL